MTDFIGIDFSGGARPWRPSVATPSVWIADIQESAGELALRTLLPVQELQGTGSPFDRLVDLLSAANFEAAAIDASFSLPKTHLPPDGHRELLRRIRTMRNGLDRPFPSASSIVALGLEVAPKVGPSL